jgi:20S proteasome alpha/beta subunit
MNKPQATNELMPVRDYAKTYYSRRGFPVTPQYIYKMISDYKKKKRLGIPFEYKEIDKQIWIVK